MKIKSLRFEQESEFEYKEVAEISEKFFIDNGQNNFSFWFLGFTAVGLSLLVVVFSNFAAANPVLVRIGQILYMCGLILYITSFRRSRYIYISDRNDHVLAHIKSTPQNCDRIKQAIEVIKSRSENVQELTAANPFPEMKPAFEHVYYDPSKMERTIDRFYENEILGFEKSLFRESVYNVKYSQLSGKVYRERSGNDIWGSVFTLVTLLISILAGFFLGFGPSFGIRFSMNLIYMLYILAALLLVSLPISFIRREVIGLYGKDGNIAYWAHVSKTNKEKVEKIIEFVQSKVSPATND